MQLPINLTSSLQTTRWKSLLDPVIELTYTNKDDISTLNTEVNALQALPLNQMVVLNNVVLAAGNNTITHGLGRTPTGWIIMDINAASTIYRSAAFNSTTLQLNSSAIATIRLGVF